MKTKSLLQVAFPAQDELCEDTVGLAAAMGRRRRRQP
jgi:hypothetical protein